MYEGKWKQSFFFVKEARTVSHFLRKNIDPPHFCGLRAISGRLIYVLPDNI